MSVCLAMIVKDEAPVIIRCLESVKPVIDAAVVCDTGSTDGTQRLIAQWFASNMAGQGQIFERPWVNFAHNRTESLQYARGMRKDFTLVIDADDFLVIPDGFAWPSPMDADAYNLQIQHNNLLHNRVQVLNNKHDWRYESVIHEFPHYDSWNTARVENLKLKIQCTADGARRRDYEGTRDSDTRVLLEAIKTAGYDQLGLRYRFCLGVHYREHGLHKEALPALLERAELPMGWDQERYMCYVYAAECAEKLDYTTDYCLALYAKANLVLPNHRADAYYGMARLCRRRELWENGANYAERGMKIVPPTNPLLHEPWMYDHGLLFELAHCAFGMGDFRKCYFACCAIWSGGHLKHQPELLEGIRELAISAAKKGAL